MLINVETSEGTHQVNLDQVWVWVRLEKELDVTITQAQKKMGEGSTYFITYGIWLASESDKDYDTWLKTLKGFDVVDNSPKAQKRTRSSTT